MRKSVIAGVAALSLGIAGAVYAAGEDTEAYPEVEWSFTGVFGSYDRAQLKRGWEVYKGVCAACHSLKLVKYRNLAAVGLGPKQIKAEAAEKEVEGEPDESGDPTERKALPSDPILGPAYKNENAARAANNGALPPDLSLITKARIGGPDYLNALLVGFGEPPKDLKEPDGKPFDLAEGLYYNKFFAGHKIAMAPPLAEADQVEYADGTKATVKQMSMDVTAFLNWAAEPELDDRKRIGIKVMLFLLFSTAVFLGIKRKIWADQH